MQYLFGIFGWKSLTPMTVSLLMDSIHWSLWPTLFQHAFSIDILCILPVLQNSNNLLLHFRKFYSVFTSKQMKIQLIFSWMECKGAFVIFSRLIFSFFCLLFYCYLRIECFSMHFNIYPLHLFRCIERSCLTLSPFQTGLFVLDASFVGISFSKSWT